MGGSACSHSAVSRLFCEMQVLRARECSEDIASEEACQINLSSFDGQK